VAITFCGGQLRILSAAYDVDDSLIGHERRQRTAGATR
jgi:hypothetical protein